MQDVDVAVVQLKIMREIKIDKDFYSQDLEEVHSMCQGATWEGQGKCRQRVTGPGTHDCYHSPWVGWALGFLSEGQIGQFRPKTVWSGETPRGFLSLGVQEEGSGRGQTVGHKGC